MGLDMYLSRKTYVKQWEHKSPEKQYEVIVKQGGKIVESVDSKKITNIEEVVGYWRKANAIHQWFVNNVQNGEDECQESYVSKDELIELLDVCKKVKEDNSLAEKLLPTQSGFFFGGTEYDEWYFKNIDSTIEFLEPLVSDDFSSGDYYYQSSW